jgi:hypothetical protein
MAKWLTRWSAKPVFEGSIPSRCSTHINNLHPYFFLVHEASAARAGVCVGASTCSSVMHRHTIQRPGSRNCGQVGDRNRDVGSRLREAGYDGDACRILQRA